MKVAAIEAHRQQVVEMEGASGARMRMLIGPEDGAQRFHMRHFEIAPGGHTPLHQHDYEHEVLVLGGEGVVRGEDGERPIRAGDVVWVPPGELHQFRSTGNEALSFICLIPAPQRCV